MKCQIPLLPTFGLSMESILWMSPYQNAAKGGVTTVATGPGSANVVGGTFIVMKMMGHRVDDMVIKDNLCNEMCLW